jgi:hypothetical protein
MPLHLDSAEHVLGKRGAEMTTWCRICCAVAVAVIPSIVSASTTAEHKDMSSPSVDSFTLEDRSVEVYFFDPLLFIGRKHPEFVRPDVPDKVKADLWLDYLHHSPIYLFSVRNSSGFELKQFCIRGDPEVQKTASFYKVAIIPGKVGGACDPRLPENARLAEKSVPAKGARGSLFEHMAIFQSPEKKKFVGNGIMLFGKYDRVTPYAEIKSAMIELMRAESK